MVVYANSFSCSSFLTLPTVFINSQSILISIGRQARGFAPALDDKLRRFSTRGGGAGFSADLEVDALSMSGDGPDDHGALVALVARFGPCLRDLFSYFATVPTSAEVRPPCQYQ
jgi:hypothetical protein